MTKKSPEHEDLYNKHKIDKKKFEELFESADALEKSQAYLEGITKDLMSKFKINSPTIKTRKESTELTEMKKIYKKKERAKNVRAQHPSTNKTAPTTPELSPLEKEPPKKKQTVNTLTKTKKSTKPKTTVLKSNTSTKKKPQTTPAKESFTSKLKKSFKAIKNTPDKPSKTPKIKSPNLKTESNEDAIKRMKERETKITDLINKKKGEIS